MRFAGGRVPDRHHPRHRPRRRLTARPYLATTARILRQLRADHRSMAMIVVVPSLLITLLYFMFSDVPAPPRGPAPFDTACLIVLGLLPMLLMFLITAISMQRERASGTLERLLVTPLRRIDLLGGYGTAFSVAALALAAATLRRRTP